MTRLGLIASTALLVACGPKAPAEGAAPAMVIEVGRPRTVGPKQEEPVEEEPILFGEPSHLQSPPEGAEAESGIVSYVIRRGDGERSPALKDEVEVRFVGWTAKGERIDGSLERDEPLRIPLKGVIEGWQRALPQMVVGERRRLWIPSDLAYGEHGRHPGDLVFDVELVSVIELPSPPPVPPDLHQPPPTAVTTSSGLTYRVLEKGTGKRHPRPADRVEVHYTGWDKTGRMFDSSIPRGRTATFPLHAVIKGWTEGLQLMVEGDHFRFWMPASLAYGSNPRPGAPAGDLVFDVELVAIR